MGKFSLPTVSSNVTAAAVGAIAVGVAAGPAASGATAAAVLGVTTAASRCITFISADEQLRVKGLTGDYVQNGPSFKILNPLSYRSAEVVKSQPLGATQYARVKNAAGEERVEKGPAQLFLGPYDELLGTHTALVASRTEYVFVLDKLTGQKRVLPGPCSFVPQPQEEASVRKGESLPRLEYLLVEDKLTGIRRLEKGPLLFFPGPDDQVLAKKPVIVLQQDEYVKLKDTKSGKQWVQRGEALVYLEPTWVQDGNVSKVISLKAFQYVRLIDNASGKVRVEKGTQSLVPGPNETMLDKKVLDAMELKVQEYVKLQDQADGTIRVVRGPAVVFLGPADKVLDGGKKSAVEIDEDHSALVRDKSTGVLRLVADTAGLFMPAADEEIERVQDRIKLADHEAVIVKNQQGHYSYFYGNEKRRPNGEPRTLFLPALATIAEQRWSRGVRRDVRDLKIKILDCRAQYMYFEFNCRTSDNVEMVLEGTFFWQISDVPAMMSQTGDVPGDVCNHARAQFIRHVSRITLKEFMADLHTIAKQVYEEDPSFYTKRGIKIRSLEVTRYSCAEESTRVILEEIIQETTNRMNRLSQAESENEVSMFKMHGRIEQEKLKTELMKIQHQHKELIATTEGAAEALKAEAFLNKVGKKVPDLKDRLVMWETLRRADTIATAACGDTKLYYSSDDVNLSFTGVGGPERKGYAAA